MIIVTLYYEEDYNPECDGYYIHLSGIINDELELQDDPILIKATVPALTQPRPDPGRALRQRSSARTTKPSRMAETRKGLKGGNLPWFVILMVITSLI